MGRGKGEMEKMIHGREIEKMKSCDQSGVESGRTMADGYWSREIELT